MVTVTNHGGHCCGSRHLYGFGRDEENNPDLITTAVSTVPWGRNIEVILNHTQVITSPRTLQRLADLGFVLVSIYKNHNHDPARPNYVFHRGPDRLPLAFANDYWSGMVITPGLQGQLPRINPANHRARDTRHVSFYDRNGTAVRIGNIVRVANPLANDFGREYVVSAYHYGEVSLTDPATGERRARPLSTGSLIFVRSAFVIPQPPANPPEPVPAVHQNAEFFLQNERPAPAAPAAPVVTVVVTLFYNFLRNGRSSAGWPTYEAARQAAPRAQRVDRRQIMSDGTSVWAENFRP